MHSLASYTELIFGSLLDKLNVTTLNAHYIRLQRIDGFIILNISKC